MTNGMSQEIKLKQTNENDGFCLIPLFDNGIKLEKLHRKDVWENDDVP